MVLNQGRQFKVGRSPATRPDIVLQVLKQIKWGGCNIHGLELRAVSTSCVGGIMSNAARRGMTQPRQKKLTDLLSEAGLLIS